VTPALLLSAALLGLAWFAAANVVLSAAVWGLVRYGRVHARAFGWRGLLTLRLLPAIGAVLVVAAFLPAHWLYEPRQVEEAYAASVWMAAAVGLFLLATAARRAAAAVVASRRLRHAWQAAARVRAGAVEGTGVVEIDGLHNLALSGIVRPTVCIGRQVRQALTAAELAVALDHELAHRGHHDNLKRFAMCAAPDALGWTAEARILEDAWAAQAECAADARAVKGDGARAVDLASALIKVARLCDAAGGRAHSPVWSTLHQRSLLDLRVRRLVSGPAPDVVDSREITWAAAVLLATAPLAMWWTGGFAAVHLLTERLIRLLP
jgi:hypothetical protein